MDQPAIDALLTFLRNAEKLKTETRTAWTSEGERESVAEHTWRLCLWATVLGNRFSDVDTGRLIKICVVHDLGEAIRGDVPAPQQGEGKAKQEQKDLQFLLSVLPDRDRKRLMQLWAEYEEAQTPEARLAKGLDKMETILQHNQGDNPADFDYRFNLDYGMEHTRTPALIASIRDALDKQTRREMKLSEGESPDK